jgi:hypothetical protein
MNIQNDEYTKAAITTLPTGATLAVAYCEKGWLIKGQIGAYETQMALTHEAMEFLLGVVMGQRGPENSIVPVPMIDLPNADVVARAEQSTDPESK